jgi:putative membrane protein
MRGKLTDLGLSILLAAMLAGPALAESDKAFLSDALKGNNAEIALGRMAQEKGSTDAVRSFGAQLVADHSEAKTQATALAAKLRVQTTDQATPQAKQGMAALQALSGKEFDAAFLRAMIDEHRKEIAAVRDKAQEGKTETSKLAAQTLPVLEKHLKTAEELSGQ